MSHDREAHKLLSNGERLRDHEGFRLRAAGLCVRGEGDGMRVLLVSWPTEGARWVVPGGGIEKGETAEAAAVRELIEEAGVKTEAVKQIGLLQDDKRRTHVFAMREREEMAEWEEGRLGRRRCWMPIAEALEKVKESHHPLLKMAVEYYRIAPSS